MPAIYMVEKRGMPLDVDAARRLRDQLDTNVSELEAQLFELANRPLNLSAARQIERVLQERGVDLSRVPRTPKADMPQFTKHVLGAIEDEFARVLLDWRAEKKMSDYVAGLWKHTHGDRLYGEFRQIGSRTGRMSSSNPNLQKLPKGDLRVRYCIAAGEGKILVGADLDSIEMRVLAAYAPGGALERAFADGIDPHQQTADRLGIDRDAGKTLNYALLYGAGPSRIAQQLGCPTAQAKQLLERWKASHLEVLRLRGRLWKQVEKHGYLEAIGGRRHYFPDGPNHMLLNRLVSGGAADLFKLAAIELHELGVEVITYVHDEMVTEVPEDQAAQTGRLLERALTRGTEKIGGLVAESATHRRWSQFKDPEWTP